MSLVANKWDRHRITALLVGNDTHFLTVSLVLTLTFPSSWLQWQFKAGWETQIEIPCRIWRYRVRKGSVAVQLAVSNDAKLACGYLPL